MWIILGCVLLPIHFEGCQVFGSPTSVPCHGSPVPCGRPAIQPVLHRVVGGHEAVEGSWPWVVMMVEINRHRCGAVIISDRLLLSAAHCFEGTRFDSSVWIAVGGRHRLDRYSEDQVFMEIDKIIVHENYDNQTIENDIVLLVLRERITFSKMIRPVCLPEPSKGVVPGQTCVLAGWGSTEGTGDNRVLNQVDLPIIDDDTCSQPDWYGTDFLPNTTFCAGYPEGRKDSCKGDSGSPLVCYDNGSWYAQGISSWGYGCAQQKWPGIYTDISKYIDWIHDQVAGIGSLCPLIG